VTGFQSPGRAELQVDPGLGLARRGQHARGRGTLADSGACGDDIDELLVLERQARALGQAMVARARQALDEVAPVGRRDRADGVVRARREDRRALVDEPGAGGAQALEAGRRARFDEDQQALACGP
jgi:hypothetical protein